MVAVLMNSNFQFKKIRYRSRIADLPNCF